MKVGLYECNAVELGNFKLDGGAMFGVVPKNLWQTKIGADELNRIPLKGRALLVRGNNRTILVDVGCGNKMPEKSKEIYGIDGPPVDTNAQLAALGVSRQDITDVVLSHLHFDHAGNSTCIQDGEVVPTFPNARYYVQKQQWELANNPSPRDRASFLPDDFLPLKSAGCLELIDGEIELMEGIRLLTSHGHTTAQQHLLVEGDGMSLFYCADLIPTSAHLPVPWHMAYDNHPLVLLEEKSAMLARAVSENWVLFFEHDPLLAAATVKEERGRIKLATAISMG